MLGTGDKNGRVEDSNNNENMDTILTRNEYLNDQTNNYFKLGRFDLGVDTGEICVRGD